MTNIQFKIGDLVIMTVDSDNNEYKGNVEIIDKERSRVKIRLQNGSDWWFNFDGSYIHSMNMSIRPGREIKEEVIECKECKCLIRETDTHVCTPSQWIEGQIPYQGSSAIFWIQTITGDIGRVYAKAKDTWSLDKEIYGFTGYTHYMEVEKPQLPPPPPAKEVEAFGYLEWDKKYDSGEIDYDKACRTEGRAFYSQPATAKVLNKYVTTLEISEMIHSWGDFNKDMTLDQWINEYLSHKQYDKLFFTPAALDMLGVK